LGGGDRNLPHVSQGFLVEGRIDRKRGKEVYLPKREKEIPRNELRDGGKGFGEG